MSNLLGLENEVPNETIVEDHSELVQRMKSGANWFYWIAGLSVVNSAIYAGGGEVSFLGGLGLALIVDVFSNEFVAAGAPGALRIVALVFNLGLAAMFGFLGYYAGKAVFIAFVIGIALYLIDSLIVLLLGDFFMAGFHAFAMIFIVRGFLACRELLKAPATA